MNFIGKSSCSSLPKNGAWMQDNVCWCPSFSGFGLEHGHVPIFWLLL